MLRNKALIVVMAIFLVLIIIYNVRFFSERSKRRNPPLQVESGGEETLPELVEPQTQKEKEPLPEGKEPLSPFWGRNPFLLPGEEKLGRSFFLASSSEEEVPVVEVQNKPEAKEWFLTAIIFSETSSRAIINHEIVQEGDTLSGGDVEVVKIMPEKVVLSRNGEPFTLSLETMVPRERKSNDEEKK